MRIIRITSAAFLTLLVGTAAIAYSQDKGEKESRPAQEQSKPEQARPAQQHAQPQQRAQPQQHQEQAKPQQRAQPQEHAQQQRSQPQQHAQQQRQEPSKPQEHAQQQVRQDQNKTQAHAQQQRQVQSNQQRAQRSNSQTRGNMQARGTPEQHRAQQASWQQHGSRNWASDHRDWQQRGGYNGYRIPDDRFRGYFGSDHGFRIGGLPFLMVGGYPRFQYDGYWFSAVDPWPDYWGANWYDNDDVYIAYVDGGYYMYDRRYPGAGVAISISL